MKGLKMKLTSIIVSIFLILSISLVFSPVAPAKSSSRTQKHTTAKNVADATSETPAKISAPASQKEKEDTFTGVVDVGVQQVNGDEKRMSSKFNMYGDNRDGVYLNLLHLESNGRQNGFKFTGTRATRLDQKYTFTGTEYGTWNFILGWTETPHLLSNGAMSIYGRSGSQFLVPSVGIPDAIDNNLTAGIAAASAAYDTTVRTQLDTWLAPIPLSTQRKEGSATLRYDVTPEIRVGLHYRDESKDGSFLTSAALGERPPRTLNAELPEPIDYRTRDLEISGEYSSRTFQVGGSYLWSSFHNDIPFMTWQSMFYLPGAGLDYRAFGARNLSNFGRLSLYPDNSYEAGNLTFGVNMPWESRLTGTFTMGKMKQDEGLLPYSISTLGAANPWNNPARLARPTAAGDIGTTSFDIRYTVSPFDHLRFTAFWRSYDLDNDTPVSLWQYPTGDATNAAGGAVTFKNSVRNRPFGYSKDNLGADVSYTFNRQVKAGFRFENEGIKRDFREVDKTTEDRFKFTVEYRPDAWVFLNFNYLKADRNAGLYNWQAPSFLYWAAVTAEATGGGDRPIGTFVNHPDLRMFDVTDRERDQWGLNLFLNPRDSLNFSFAYSSRNDDYTSPTPQTAMIRPAGAPAFAFPATTVTPGVQLGLLDSDTTTWSFHVNYSPLDPVSLWGYYLWDQNKFRQRGFVFSEDNKDVAAPDWDDTDKFWESFTRDTAHTIGLGAQYSIDKWLLGATYTIVNGTVQSDIVYGSFIMTNPGSLHVRYFPDAATTRIHTLNLNLNYSVSENWEVGFHYLAESFRIRDWMQDPLASNYVVDTVDNDGFNERVGGRLVSLGFLAPDYNAHLGMISMKYKW